MIVLFLSLKIIRILWIPFLLSSIPINAFGNHNNDHHNSRRDDGGRSRSSSSSSSSSSTTGTMSVPTSRIVEASRRRKQQRWITTRTTRKRITIAAVTSKGRSEQLYFDIPIHDSHTSTNNNDNNNDMNDNDKKVSCNDDSNNLLFRISSIRGGGGGGSSAKKSSSSKASSKSSSSSLSSSATKKSIIKRNNKKKTNKGTSKKRQKNQKKKEKKKKITTKKVSFLEEDDTKRTNDNKNKNKRTNDNNNNSDSEEEEQEHVPEPEPEENEINMIQQVIHHEKDTGEVLGDAIRNRADQIRSQFTFIHQQQQKQPFGIHPSIQSVGWAIGASDYYQNNNHRRRRPTTIYKEMILSNNNNDDDEEEEEENDDSNNSFSGEVDASPSSVVAHYFLKSHGGAHAIQCMCSLLALTSGLLSLVVVGNSNNNALQLTLQKRCLTFAMMKHITGILSAVIIAAKEIPNAGFRKTHNWIIHLINNPVSQYVFYSACLLVWLPSSAASIISTTTTTTNKPVTVPPPTETTGSGTTTSTATTTTSTATKTSATTSLLLSIGSSWQSYPLIHFCIIGPIVLRELISTMFVLSDVLILWTTSANNNNSNSNTSVLLTRAVLNGARIVVNSIMSILVTPKKWKESNPSQRQMILAQLTSKCTLFMELIVGIVMIFDTVWNILSLLFMGGTVPLSNNNNNNTTILQILKRLICTRLYIHFLWNRRKKISKLVLEDIRGGASELPFHIFDILLHPMERMGFESSTTAATRTTTTPKASNGNNNDNKKIHYTWKEYVRIALNVDDSL